MSHIVIVSPNILIVILKDKFVTNLIFMENTVYYTYSTVSQTIAAMVALLGVLSIYQLQSLNNKFIGLTQNYLDTLLNMEKDDFMKMSSNPHRELSNHVVFKNYDGILSVTDKVFKMYGDSFPDLDKLRKSIILIFNNKQQVIKKSIHITLVSLLVIAGSILILSFASNISTKSYWLIFIPFFSIISYLLYRVFNLIKFSLTSDF